MADVRLDRVLTSSFHEAYKNYLTTSGTINASGTVPNGSTVNFSTTINYTRGGTRADIYIDGNSVKALANAGGRLVSGGPYLFASTETASMLITYTTTAITVTLSVFNGTGSSLALTAQALVISVVQYDAPITAI
jgi:hypothetical protein